MKENEVLDTEINEADVKKAESMIMKDYLEVEDTPFGKLRIYHANMAADSAIDDFYNQEFLKIIKDSDCPTLHALEELLDDRGLWTDEHEIEIDKIRSIIQTQYVEIASLKEKKTKHNKKTTEASIKKHQDKAIESTKKLTKLIMHRSSLLESCAEKRAEKMAIKFKLVKCVTNESGEPIWNSVEEFDKESAIKVTSLISDAVRWWSNISDPLFAGSLDQVFGSSDTDAQ